MILNIEEIKKSVKILYPKKEGNHLNENPPHRAPVHAANPFRALKYAMHRVRFEGVTAS